MNCVMCEDGNEEEALFYIKFVKTHGREGGYDLCGICLIRFIQNYESVHNGKIELINNKEREICERNKWMNKYLFTDDGRKIAYWGLISERRIK